MGRGVSGVFRRLRIGLRTGLRTGMTRGTGAGRVPAASGEAGHGAGFARLRPALFRAAACLALAAAALLAVPGGAQAQENPVRGWSLTPSGLSDGDRFRLIFVTTDTGGTTSSDIEVYNAFVQSQAAAGHTAIRAYSSQFRVVGSTATVDARDNTGTTGTGVPIYWLNGSKVADNYADFYDGSWDDEANPRNQSGRSIAGTLSAATGSNDGGTEYFAGDNSSHALGKATLRSGRLNDNRPGINPLSAGNRGAGSSSRFYALSPVFTVKGPPKITDVSVTSRPADGTNTFKRGEPIEVTVTFDEAVEVQNPGAGGANARVEIWVGGSSPLHYATFLRMDHPRKIVFGLSVFNGLRDNNGLCIGAACTDSDISLQGAAAIVAATDGVAAQTAFAAQQTSWRINGNTQGPTGGVCGRQPAVRDAIVAAVSAADTCAEVTAAHLRDQVGTLNLSGKGIASLHKRDFQGLTSLHTLHLSNNALDHVPVDLFEHLDTSLRTLKLNGNPLGALPAGLFDGLDGITTLDLADAGLTDLPAGLFANLRELEELRLVENGLRAFPAAALADVAGTLETLFMRDNGMASIAAGALDGFTQLRRLELQDNALAALPAGLFDDATRLVRLNLRDNLLASLPDDLLRPLTRADTVELQGNPGFAGFAPAVEPIAAQTVERGVRVDLAAETGASPWGDNVTWSWERTDTSGATVTLNDAETATPWFDAPVRAVETALAFEATARGRGTSGASASEAARTARVTVPPAAVIAGVSVTSRPRDGTNTFKRGEPVEITVTFSEPVRARIPDASAGMLIQLVIGSSNLTAGFDRSDHPNRLIFRRNVAAADTDGDGIRIGNISSTQDSILLTGDASITAVSDGTNANVGFETRETSWRVNGSQQAPSGGVCGRHPAVRDALVAAVSAASACGDVTGTQLAGIASLDLSRAGIDSLRRPDFAGLGGLTGLDLSGNALDYLPRDLFDHVPALTELVLQGNDIGALFGNVFNRLTALEVLDLRGNALSALPAGVFDKLTELRRLLLVNNGLASLPDNVFAPLTKLGNGGLWIGNNPGFGDFVPRIEAGVPAQTVLRGARVDLEAAVKPNPWGSNLVWSWTQTDSTGETVTLEDARTGTARFVAPALAAETVLAFEATATGRGTAGLGSPSRTTAAAGVTVKEGVLPELAGAAVGTSGLGLTLTFSEDLDNGAGRLPPIAAFAVKVDGAAATVTAVGEGPGTGLDSVMLSLDAAAPVGRGQIVTVSYAVPATGMPIADVAGNRAAAFTDVPAVNNSTVANTAPPVPLRAAVPASGGSLTLTFNEDLDTGDGLPPAGAFTVEAGGAAVTVQSVTAGDGPDSLVLRLPAGAVERDETVTVGYAVPATGAGVRIADTDGNEALAFAGFPAANDSTADGTPPELASAEVPASGDKVILTFSEPVWDSEASTVSVPEPGRFTVKSRGLTFPVDSVDRSTANPTQWVLVLAAGGINTVRLGDVVTLSYRTCCAGFDVEDLAGNEAGAFTDVAVVNNSTFANTNQPVPFRAAVPASGDSLTLTFNEDLDIAADRLPPASAFTVEADGVAAPIQSVAMGAGTDSLVFGLGDEAIRTGQTVTVSYAVPAANPVADTDGNEARAFTGFAAANDSTVAADETPPALAGAEVPASGDKVILTFDEDLDFSGGAPFDVARFAVHVDGVQVTLGHVSAEGTDGVSLVLSGAAIQARQVVTVSYLQEFALTLGGPRIADLAGNEAVSFLRAPAVNGSTVANTAPPVPESAEVTLTGGRVDLVFNETIASSAGAAQLADAFTVEADGDEVAVSFATAFGDSELLLSLVGTIERGQTVTVSYAVPATGAVEDADGNEAAAFADFPVSNDSAVDATAPVLASAEVPAAGDKLTLVFDEAIDLRPARLPPAGAFTVMADGAAVAVESVAAGDGPDSLVLNLSDTIFQGQAVAAVYTVPGSGPRIEDAAGNDSGAFPPDVAVVNNSAETRDPPELAGAEVPAAGDTLTLVFDETLDIAADRLPPAGAFAVKADGAAVAVQSVSEGSGPDRFVLGLSSAIEQGRTVSVSYTVPAAGAGVRIADVVGNETPGFTDLAVTNNSTVTVRATVTIAAEHDRIGGGLEDLVFTLRRDGATGHRRQATVTIEQDRSWLAAPELSHTVTFAVGDATATLTVPASRFSFAPTATGKLTATVSGEDIVGGSDMVEVVSIPGTPITVGLELSEYSFAEDDADAAFHAVATLDAAYPRAPSASRDFAVAVTTESGTAVFREDFAPVNVTLGFDAADYRRVDGRYVARKRVSDFAILDDDVYEVSEAFVVKVESTANLDRDMVRIRKPDGSAGNYDVTVTDEEDRPVLALSADPPSIAEEDDSATGRAENVSTLTVAITNGKTFAADKTVTLTFGGTATRGTHYGVSPADADTGAAGRQVALPAGDSAVAVTVTAAGNTTADGNRTVVVSAADGATDIGRRVVTILDDETMATNSAAGGAPAIDGVAQAGNMLTATVSDILDEDGLPASFDYRWVRVDGSSDGTTVGGNAGAYTVSSADVGSPIRVEVSFIDGAGNPEGPLASEPVGPAAAALGSCPAASDWRATMTMGYVSTDSSLSQIEDFGFIASSSFGGLDRTTFAHGSTNYTVTEIFRVRVKNNSTNVATSDGLGFRVSGGDVPDGTVLNLGGTALTVGPDSAITGIGWEQWNLVALGLSPPWVGGQEMRVCANLPPGLVSATVRGRTLVLTYDQDLDAGSEPAPGAYSVTANGTAAAPSAVAVSGRTVTLTLAAPVAAGAAVTVGYTPGGSPVRDESRIEALAFGSRSVEERANAAPVFGDGMGEMLARDLAENQPSGTAIGAPVTATDADGDRLTYSLRDTRYDNYFAIDAVTGQLSSVRVFDFEDPLANTLGIYVVADDGQGGTAEVPVVVTVTDLPEETPPAPASAEVAASGAQLSLTFDEDLDTGDGLPPADAFTVEADGAGVAVQSVASGAGTDSVILSLPAGAIGRNQVVTVSYAVPGVSPLQDADGNETAAFTDFPVTNNSNVANTTPPVLAGASVPATGSSLTLTFNEDLDIGATGPFPPADAFTVKADGVEVAVQSIGALRLDQLQLSLPDDAIGQDQVVTVSYAVPATNPIQDADGNETAAFTDFPVTNGSTVANTTPPVPAGAAVPASGSSLTLAFNEDLDIGEFVPFPPADAFTVKADGVEVAVQSIVAAQLDQLLLDLPTGAIGQGQVVTVSYAVPATGPIQDADGNKTVAFTDFPVTNGSTVDKTPPVLAGASVPATGSSLTLTFNEDLDIGATGPFPPADAFTVKADGVEVAVQSIGALRLDQLQLSLPDDAIGQDQIVTVSYEVPATNPIQDADGNKTAAFTDFPVTNGSTVANTTPPVPASAEAPATGSSLTLAFNEALDTGDGLPPAEAFTVKADGAEVAVDGVAAAGGDGFVLDLPAGAIRQGQVVTVSYSVPATGPIQDADGNETAAFTDFPVTNNSTVTADGTPPVPASAAVPASGSSLTLAFNKALDIGPGKPLPPADAFTVEADGAVLAVDGVAAAGGDGFVLDLPAGAIRRNQVVTVSYAVPATAPIQDAAGNKTAAFDDFPVTNNSTVERANAAPAFEDETLEFEVPENEPPGTDIGAPVTATDADGDTVTYSLGDTPHADRFAIDAATGQLRTAGDDPFDFEGLPGNPLELEVVADDGRGGTAEVAVAVTVTDVQEPPLAPDAPSVDGGTDNKTSLEVSWKAPDNDGRPDIVRFDLQYRTSRTGSGGWQDGLHGKTGTSATITDLQEGTQYDVQVRAVNADGDGPWSDSGRGTPGVAPASKGDVQLVGVDDRGNRVIKPADGIGRLEVFYKGEWGTVCNDRFDRSFPDPNGGVGGAVPNVAAKFACQKAGYATGTMITRPEGMNVLPDVPKEHDDYVPILLDDVRCAAGPGGFPDMANHWRGKPATMLHHCWNAGVGLNNCVHDEDVHLQCTGTLESAAQDGGEPLTAEFEDVPASHDGAAPFTVRLVLSEAVANDADDVREHALTVTGGIVTAVTEPSGQDAAWAIEITPDGPAPISIVLDAGRECGTPGALCTADGRGLAAAQLAVVAGPAQAALTVQVLDLPTEHDGEAAFWFRLRFSEDIFDGTDPSGTGRKVRDALDIAGGSTESTRRDDRSAYNEWWIKARPDGDGPMTIAVNPPAGCTGATVFCTPDGRPLSKGESMTVPGPEGGTATGPGAALTVRLLDVPEEHDGSTLFRFRIRFSEDIFAANASGTGRQVRLALDVTGGQTQGASRDDRNAYNEWWIGVQPDGNGPITITASPPAGCTGATVFCTPDGRALSRAASETVQGPVGISIADATVQEGPGAELAFSVTLSRSAAHPVSVGYVTEDGTAHEDTDYLASAGNLDFAPGETRATIRVPVLDDAHDEGAETMTVRLRNASGAYIADGEATGTIENTDLMPQAWLARFGRTVAEQVLDAVEERIRSAPQAGVQVTLAGQRLGGAAPEAEALEEAEARARLEDFSTWLKDGAEAPDARPRSRAVAPRELLTGSSFALTTGAEGIGGGVVSLWGRGAVSRFDGREGELSLSGEVTGAMLGTDWTRERWTLGLMLSHARGEGSYREAADSGEVASTVTGLYPYGRYMLSDRVTVWGAAGYGAGTLVLTPGPAPDADPGDGEAYETDMDLAMAAAGLRGVVVQAPAEGGPELVVKTDALGVQTSSEAVRGGDGGNLAAAQGDVTRLRLGLEGTWRGLAIGTGTLEPRLEVGVRHDGGDAETGFGLDLGGGLAWSDPATGIRAEASGRGLLTHESAGFRERGFAGSFGWDPAPGTDRGPSLTLTQTVGVSARGGADALLGRTTLAGLAANDDGDELERRRFEVRFGYGFGAFGDRFTSRPEAGFGLSEGHREYGLVWRLVRDRRRGDLGSLELLFEARRQESANDDTPPEHTIGFRLTSRF